MPVLFYFFSSPSHHKHCTALALHYNHKGHFSRTRCLQQPRLRHRELYRLRRTHAQLAIHPLRILIAVALPSDLILVLLLRRPRHVRPRPRLPLRRRLHADPGGAWRRMCLGLVWVVIRQAHGRAEDLGAQLRCRSGRGGHWRVKVAPGCFTPNGFRFGLGCLVRRGLHAVVLIQHAVQQHLVVRPSSALLRRGRRPSFKGRGALRRHGHVWEAGLRARRCGHDGLVCFVVVAARAAFHLALQSLVGRGVARKGGTALGPRSSWRAAAHLDVVEEGIVGVVVMLLLAIRTQSLVCRRRLRGLVCAGIVVRLRVRLILFLLLPLLYPGEGDICACFEELFPELYASITKSA